MSWTNECTESNVFKIREPQEVTRVLELMGFNVYESTDGLSFVTSGEGTFFDENTEVVLSAYPIKVEDKEAHIIGIISDYTNDSIDLDTVEEDYGVAEEEVQVVPLIDYLQDQLLEDEHITITCAGFESRMSGSFSPFGDVTIITKTKVRFVSLAQEVDKYLEGLAKD